MKIKIVEYDQQWPKLFEQERGLLLRELGKVVAEIEHIGSTAVPGLAGKPVIDIMIGLYDFADADDAMPKMSTLGYSNIKYEDFAQRRFFKKIHQGRSSYNSHMVEIDSLFWKRHLLFRDYLRNNSKVAAEYVLLKKELAKRQWKVSNDYAEAKTQLIRKIEEKARRENAR